MAKKEDKKLETDGLDDLDDLDLPDLDLGMDPGNDDRTPVRKLSAGFAQGVKSDLTDHRQLPNRLKRLMPEQYESSFEMADFAAGTVGELYNTVRRETKEGVTAFKKMSRGFLDEHESKVPERFRERLKKLTATEEKRRGQSVEEQRDSQISDSMASIFAAQNEAQEEGKKEERAENTLREVMESHRHEGQMDLLRGMRSDIARQVSYQDQIAARWQRKSLELQYRQLFVGRDLLKVAEVTGRDTKEALREIVKNTSLPEYRKIELTEAAGQEFRNAMMRGVGNRLGDFWGDLRKNAGKMVRSRSQNLSGALSMTASAREQIAGASDMVDPMAMGGDMAGSAASSGVIGRLADWGRTKLAGNEKLMERGNNFERFVRDMPLELQQRTRDGELFGPEVPGSYFLNQIMSELIPTSSRSDTLTGGAKIEDSRSPAIFDQLTRRSIVEIIPGYLARIHEEITGLRGSTGGGMSPGPGGGSGPSGGGRLEFDLHTGEFVTRDKMLESIRDNVLTKRDSEQIRDRMSVIMDVLDPDGQLSVDDRQALTLQLLETASQGSEKFDPIKFAEGRFKGDINQDARESLRDFFTERFGVQEEFDEKGELKTTMREDKQTAQLRNFMSQQFKALQGDISDPTQQIQAYMDIGLTDHLRELGIVTQNEQGEDTFDRSRYFKGLESGQWDKTLTEEERLEQARQDETRRVENWRRRQEEEERKHRAQKEARELYERSFIGRTHKRVNEAVKEKTKPATDYLADKGTQAATELQKGARSAADILTEQNRQFTEALGQEDKKKALGDLLAQKRKEIKDLVVEKNINPTSMRETAEKQIARIQAFAREHDVDQETVEKWVRDTRDDVEKNLIRLGKNAPNVPYMGTLAERAQRLVSPEVPDDTTSVEGSISEETDLEPGRLKRTSDHLTQKLSTLTSKGQVEALQGHLATLTRKLEEKGVSRSKIDATVKDLRDEVEKNLIRLGQKAPNIPFGVPLMDTKRKDESSSRVTELPYTSIQATQTSTGEFGDYASTLAGSLGLPGSVSEQTQELVEKTTREVNQESREREAAKKNVKKSITDMFGKTRSYLTQDNAGKVLYGDALSFIDQGEAYLKEQLDKNPVADSQYLTTLTEQARRLNQTASQKVNRIKEGLVSRYPSKEGETSDERTFMGRLGRNGDRRGVDDLSGMGNTPVPDMDRSHGNRGSAPYPSSDTYPGVQPDQALVSETLNQLMTELNVSQEGLLDAVRGIQRTLDGRGSETNDTDRLIEAIESTVDQEHRDTQLMLLTRIIETLQVSASISAEASGSTESWFSIKDVAKKTGRFIGATGRGLGRYYSGVFRGMGSIAAGGGRGIGAALTGLGRGTGSLIENAFSGSKDAERAADVYLSEGSSVDPWTGKPVPVLTKRKMAKGFYIDSETRRPIKTLKALGESKGDILEISPGESPQIVLTQEEMGGGLVDRTGKPLDVDTPRRGGVGSLIGSGVRGLGRMYGNMLGVPARILGAITSKATNLTRSYINRVIDVYVKGEEFPRTRGVIMERGGYVDGVSGEIVDHQDKIRGPVHDLEGREVISMEDIQRGLVDIHGDSIKVGSRLLAKAGRLIKKPFDIAKWGVEKSLDFLKWGGGAVKDLVGGIANFFQKGITEETGNKQLEVLEQIRDLLDERLEAKNRWDGDGDGFRDGGWRQRFAANDEDGGEGSPTPTGTPTEGMLGKIGGMLAGAAGALNPFGGGGDEDEGSTWDNIKDGAFGAAVYKLLEKGGGLLNKGKGLLARGAALGAAKLGITGVSGGLSLAALVPLLPKIAIGAAIVGGGYYIYRRATQDRSFGALSKLRMLQYGFSESDEDNIAKVLHLEKELKPHVRLSNGEAEIDFENVDLMELAQGIGLDLENRWELEVFSEWLANRFYPIFLTHYAALKSIGSTYGFGDVDERLTLGEKATYLQKIRTIEGFDQHPYQVRIHPFDARKRLTVTADDIQQAFANITEEIDDDEMETISRGGSVSLFRPSQGMRTITNLREQDALDNWEEGVEEESGGPRILPLNTERRRYTSITGNEIRVTRVERERVNAIDAIRYKAYGLKELQARRVSQLRDLEKDVLDYVEYESDKAVFVGSVDDIGDGHYSSFGLGWIRRSARREWREWFEFRFLPLYLRYLTTLHRLSADYDTAKENLSKNANLSLDLAQAFLETLVDVDGEEVSTWAIVASPWRNDTVNSDPGSTDENFEALRVAAEDNTLEEESESEAPVRDPVAEQFRESLNEAGQQDRGGSSSQGAITVRQRLGAGNAPAPAHSQSESDTGPYPSTPSGPVDLTRIPRGEGYNAVLAMMEEQGITDPTERAMMLAHLAHESGNFQQLEENLRYSVDNMMRVWPSRFPNRSVAAPYSGNPEALANNVYGNRMGNTEPGDGWKYRGRGFIQLTGKDNYVRASQALGYDYVNDPDLLLDPNHAARASIWWWKQRSGLQAAAQRGDVRQSTKLINGGYNGLSDRQQKFRQYQALVDSGQLDQDLQKASEEQMVANQTAQSEVEQETEVDTGVEASTTPEVDRQEMVAGLVGNRSSSTGQLTPGSASPVSEGSTSSSEEETPVSTTVATSWAQDTPGGSSGARREAADITYVGSGVTPDQHTRDEVSVVEQRQREQRVSQERDELTRREQHSSTESLSALVELAQRSLHHQERMDGHLEQLVSMAREQSQRPDAIPVPAEHRQDSTHQDLVAAARRQGRNNPTQLPSGAVNVSRGRIA